MSDLFDKAKESIKKDGLPIVEEERSRLPLYISLREFPLRYQLGVSKLQKFFEGLKEGKVYATQCNVCRNKFFPPRADCPKCLTTNVNWMPLDPEGQLLTYTVIRVKPSSFAHYKDYVVGIAQLKEGIRVLAWVNVDDPEKIKPNMKVYLTTARREPEGYITYELTLKAPS
ncbi:MAG: Zn-ribbon domain-containing OB-fold protein [Thaumarchaeota archaeon]|nr:Zn-ribbon domain-containing OB-fold protein [Nitrososphaerota archaeon]